MAKVRWTRNGRVVSVSFTPKLDEEMQRVTSGIQKSPSTELQAKLDELHKELRKAQRRMRLRNNATRTLGEIFRGFREAASTALIDSVRSLARSLTRSSDSTKVKRPPGALAFRILKFIFSSKVFYEIFAQAIADMREEYFEALAEGENMKARWIAVRGNLGLVLTVGVFLVSSIGKKVLSIWKVIP